MNGAPPEADQELAALYRSGVTLDEIAAELGVSRQRIHQRLQRCGVSRKDKPGTTRVSVLDGLTWTHINKLGGSTAADLAAKRRAHREEVLERLVSAIRRAHESTGRSPTAREVTGFMGITPQSPGSTLQQMCRLVSGIYDNPAAATSWVFARAGVSKNGRGAPGIAKREFRVHPVTRSAGQP